MVTNVRVLPLATPLKARKLSINPNRMSGLLINPTHPSGKPPIIPIQIAQTNLDGIASINSIPISNELATGHYLERFIRKENPISSSDIEYFLDKINLNLTYYENGGIPASPNDASEYNRKSWRRDNAIVIHSMFRAAADCQADKLEVIERAKVELTRIASFDTQPFHRGHFTSFLWPDQWSAKSRYSVDVNGLPRVMSSINQDGYLDDYHDWAHNQLDSLGSWLFTVFHAANSGELNLKELDNQLSEQNPENKLDSIFSVAIQFLNKIEYWDQIDKGPWEKVDGHRRASSIGICLAAFKEAKKYFERNGWDREKVINIHPNVDLKKMLEDGIKYGDEALAYRIPSDGRKAVETNEIPNDSALAFLLLINPGLSEVQETAILKTLYGLMGEVGFKRMEDHIDTYMGMNYADNPDGLGKWSAPTPDHKAAEWTLFDHILAIHFYRKFREKCETSGIIDKELFLRADKHFKRSLAQITRYDYNYKKFVNKYEKKQVFVQGGSVPEAYWLRKNESGKEWLPNENSPLLMANATFTMMLSEAIDSIKLWQSLNN